MIFLWVILGISLLLVILLCWVKLDYTIGRNYHLKRETRHTYSTRFSDIDVFTHGADLYNQLENDIKHATSHIHLLFFILRDDAITHQFLDLLIKKRKEGVEVRLLLDRVGSIEFNKKMIQQMKDASISIGFTRAMKFPFLFYTFNRRNHRKIAVIDGKIGYLGGFNIGEEYLGKNAFLGVWRDYHLRMTGEGVTDLQHQFLSDWFRETSEDFRTHAAYFPVLQKGEIKHHFVTTNGAYLLESFLETLDLAKKSVFIGSPYFIPEKKLMKKLLTLLAQGVELHILLPQRSDHFFVFDAALPYIRTLTLHGANIYFYRDGFFHGKTIVIDDTVCDIGTANFDRRSLFWNDEMNCIIENEDFTKKFREHIKTDMQKSNRIDIAFFERMSFFEKVRAKVAQVFAFLM